jgi:hypothetical protein
LALVVLLRGINVGGHRTFRPTEVAKQLKHLDAVNIGAAGTFVVRQRVSRAALRAEFAQQLPFDAEIAVCGGHELVGLMSRDFFTGQPARPDIVRFVCVFSRPARLTAPMPMSLPASGPWLVRILATENGFAVGVYRRQMKVIRHLTALDGVFGAPAIVRNWNTMAAIARVLEGERE